MQTRHYKEPGTYLALVRAADSALNAGKRVRLHWSSKSLDRAGWIREFRAALNKRINAKTRAASLGRKDSDDYLASARRDQRRLHDKLVDRVRVSMPRFETDEVQRRFGHLIEEERDAF